MNTVVTDHITEGLANPFKWGRAHLSPSRSRAFDDQLAALNRTKWSKETNTLANQIDEMRYAYVKSRAEELKTVAEQAHARVQEIEAQIDALRAERQRVLDAKYEAENVITGGFYNTEEYKTHRAIVEELYARDEQAHTPRVLALMQKFYAKQMLADSKEAN